MAFVSDATNLHPDATTADTRVYRRNLDTDVNRLVSRTTADAAADGTEPTINADGTVVAFTSETALHGDDNNTFEDVYRRDVQAGTTELVSRTIANAGSTVGADTPSISADGDDVAFSSASQLDPVADTNSTRDVYVRSGLVLATTALVSRATGAAGLVGDLSSTEPSISADGQRVAFVSTSGNLGGPADSTKRVFIRDLGLNSTALISRATGAAGAAADGDVEAPSLDDGGDVVVFAGSPDNVSTEDDDDFRSVYVRRVATSETLLASRPTAAGPFIGGGIAHVSVRSNGDVVSASGRYVVFASPANALSTADDDRFTNVFRVDVVTGEMVLVSRADGLAGAAADDASEPVGISADGDRVAFATEAATLAADALVGEESVYVREIAAGRTTLVSRGGGLAGAPVEIGSDPDFSADGRHVAFRTSEALDGGDGNGLSDVYVRDLDTGAVALASRANGAGGAAGDALASSPSLSTDGQQVAFSSAATNLGTGDGPDSDVFVRDLAAGTTMLASRADGADGAAGDDNSGSPSLSGDGQRVAFDSQATNLGSGADPEADVFVRDLAAGRTLLASRVDGPDGAEAASEAESVSISGDGRRVLFSGDDDFLVAGDTNGREEPFVRDLESGRTFIVARADGQDGAISATGAFAGGLSANGRCAAFAAQGTGLVASVPGGDFTHAYLRALDGECPEPEPIPISSPSPAPSPTPSPAPIVVPIVDPAPVLSAFKISPTRFYVRKRATIRYTLSEAATVTITIAREEAGRKSGKRCVKPTAKLRRRAKCTRLVTAGTIRRASKKGANKLTFDGRIGRKSLRLGRHRATAVARDTARHASKSRTARFTIISRPRRR